MAVRHSFFVKVLQKVGGTVAYSVVMKLLDNLKIPELKADEN